MDTQLFQTFLEWVKVHQTWAGVIVMLVAMSESLAVVGMIVPGVVMIIGAGALVALGALEWWSTVAWATVGAILGDGVSYWLGWHYRDRICRIWPLSRHPTLIVRGTAYFQQHGGKSVLFGRFVGPMRAIVPMIAGVMRMPVWRFLLIDVIAAAAWAPAYLLPGVVFGASLNLATEVASRLVVLVVGVALGVWLVLWLTYRGYAYFLAHADAMLTRAGRWARSHPHFGGVVRAIIDPQEPEARGVAILALILLAAGWALLLPMWLLDAVPFWSSADLAFYRLMQGLRTPWADQLLLTLSALGEFPVLLALGAAVSLWLAWRRHWLALAHWCATYAFGIALTLSAGRGIPGEWAAEIEGAWSPWEATHLTLGLAVYGFLAVLVAQGLRGNHHWWAYGAAGLIVSALTLAQIYLGGQSLSGAAVSLLLAGTWTLVLGVAYRRHLVAAPSTFGIGTLSIVTLVAAVLWYHAHYHERDVARYGAPSERLSIAADAWWHEDWRALPAARVDFYGSSKQPMTVQWAGDLEVLRSRLVKSGWRSPRPANGGALLQWLRSDPPLAELPVLPQVHDGKNPALMLIRRTDRKDRVIVLRLWPSAWAIAESGAPVWTGYAAYLVPRRGLLLTVPVTGSDFDAPLQALHASLDGLERREVRRDSLQPQRGRRWNGEVLLVRPKQDDEQ